MSQLSDRAKMGETGENERLTMNQSWRWGLLEWLSGAEGHPRSETHALTMRVEDDALVAKDYLLPW